MSLSLDNNAHIESVAAPTPDVSAPVDDPAPSVSAPPAPASVSAGYTLDWDNIAEAVWGKPLSVSYMGAMKRIACDGETFTDIFSRSFSNCIPIR